MSIDVIIYLGKEQQKKDAVQNALESQKLNYKFVSENELGLSISSLFELEDIPATSDVEDILEEDLMLFKEIEDDTIIEISKQLNELGHNISRKAMLTEHNRVWSLYDLLLEITEEHHYFNVRGELIQAIQEIMKKDPNNVSSELQLLVMSAYDAVQKETPIKQLEQLLQDIKSK